MNTWLEFPADIVGEEGIIRILEPADADLRRIRYDIQAGCYAKPFILDDGKLRKLYFNLRFVQSAMRLDTPLALELAYTRLMAAFLLFLPNPKQLLMVGLGGGSLARFCHRRLPRAHITVVEIDATVIAMAGQFGLVPDERLSIVHADAARHMPLTEADSDVVLLDAFDGDGLSGSLLDPGFYRAVRRRLRPRGLLVANLAGDEDCWRAHLSLLRRAFDDRVILVRLSGGDNHVAFAFTDAAFPPSWALLEKPARELQRTHGLDFPDFLRRMRRAAGR